MLDEHLERKFNIERADDPTSHERNGRGTREPTVAARLLVGRRGSSKTMFRFGVGLATTVLTAIHAGRAAWRRCSATGPQKGGRACRAPSRARSAGAARGASAPAPRAAPAPVVRSAPPPAAPARAARRPAGSGDLARPRRSRAWPARNSRARASRLRHRAPRQAPPRASSGGRAIEQDDSKASSRDRQRRRARPRRRQPQRLQQLESRRRLSTRRAARAAPVAA